MKIARLIYQIKPPCSKCPYTLGEVHTFTNPCPKCKENGYRMYERFLREITGEIGIYSEKRKEE